MRERPRLIARRMRGGEFGTLRIGLDRLIKHFGFVVRQG
jgi:hypothetical protein